MPRITVRLTGSRFCPSRLKLAIAAAGTSQTRLQRELTASGHNINMSRIAAGVHAPSATSLFAIAKMLGKPMEYFFVDLGEPMVDIPETAESQQATTHA